MKAFYDDKNLNPPSDFTDWEQHLWRISMLSALSVYIDPETWQMVYDKKTAEWKQIKEWQQMRVIDGQRIETECDLCGCMFIADRDEDGYPVSDFCSECREALAVGMGAER